MASRRPLKFKDYLRAVARRRGLVAASAAVFVAAAALALERQPAFYLSAALIEAVPKKPGEAKADGADVVRAKAVAVPENGPLIDAALADTLADQNQSPSNLGSELRSSLRVTQTAQGRIRLSVCASDPAVAARFVNDLAARLIAETAPSGDGRLPGKEQIDSTRMHLAEVSERLRELEGKAPWLADFRGDAPPPGSTSARTSAIPAEAVTAQQLTIESLKDRQYLLEQQLADLEPRIATVRRIVEAQKKGSRLSDNPTYAALISRRADLEGQRDTLINRQELTEKHPKVTAITDQIAAINRQIEVLRQQDAGQIEQSAEARELRSLESDRNRLKLELEVNTRELSRRTATAGHPPAPASPRTATTMGSRSAYNSPQHAELAARYQATKRDYEESIKRLEGLEPAAPAHSGPADSEFSLRLAEAAAVAERPIERPTGLLLLLALGAGLLSGIVASIAVESPRFSKVEDARDVAFYSRLPMLGTLPKAPNPEAQNSGRRRRMAIRIAWRTALTVAFTLALAAALLATNLLSPLGGS